MITLEITQRDIELALKYRKLRKEGRSKGFQGYISKSCPIANACRRKFHNDAQVSSSLTITKNVNGKSIFREFLLSQSAKQFIFNFDLGRTVFPTAVHLTER